MARFRLPPVVAQREQRRLWSGRLLLSPGRQALLLPVHLRKGETIIELGAGLGVSAATAWRCVSGKRRVDGMNVRVIASPDGPVVRTSGAPSASGASHASRNGPGAGNCPGGRH